MIIERAFEDRLAEMRAPTLEHTVVIDAADGALSLEQLVALGAPEFDVDAAARAVAPDDLLTLIYTSGTTGPPKGVQLTHANMLCTMRGYRRAIPEMGRGKAVSYLPMAHIFARWLDHYHAMWAGGEVTCVADPRAVIAALPTVRPTRFVGVPRVWEKLKAGLEAAMAAEHDPQRREATRWALDVGLRVVRARQSGKEPDEQLAPEHVKAERLVLARIRGRLGSTSSTSPGWARRRRRWRCSSSFTRWGSGGRRMGDVRNHDGRHRQQHVSTQARQPSAGRYQESRSGSARTARCWCAATTSWPATATSRTRRRR